MRRLLLMPLAILTFAVVVGAGIYTTQLYNTQDATIFPRTINHVPAPNPAKAAFEKLTLTTPDGDELRGISFPATKPSPTLILAFAGNAHDVVGFSNFLKNTVFPQGSVSVAGLAYRGYPNGLGVASTGTPTEVHLKADALQMYDTLTPRARPGRVVAIGYSLGSAVATYLATQRHIDDLILVAPPASIRRLATEQYPFLPVGPLVKYPWATEDIIGQVKAPITLFYTPTDGLIPTSHVGILQKAHPGMKIVEMPGAKHGDILDHTDMPQQLRNALGE